MDTMRESEASSPVRTVRLPSLPVLNAREVTDPGDYFHCTALGGNLFARACLARQDRGGGVTETNLNRGGVAYFPTCSVKCVEGGAIRERLNFEPTMRWRRRWGLGSFIKTHRFIVRGEKWPQKRVPWMPRGAFKGMNRGRHFPHAPRRHPRQDLARALRARGLKLREIAVEMGITEGTVSAMIYRTSRRRTPRVKP